MSILNIVELPEKSLREKSKPIKKIDKRIKNLISDMKNTLIAQEEPEGIGLAAPQVGKNIRLFIVDFNDLKRVVINPKVLKRSKENKKTQKNEDNPMEGCLSYPHYYGPLNRPDYIKIRYLNEKGKEIVEEFKGFEAQIIQHEIDHLNGILFVDHIIKEGKPLFKYNKNGEWEEVDLI